MEEKEQEDLRRQEDKDYGFPFVDVKPLSSTEIQKSEPSQSVEPVAESTIIESETAVPGSLSNPIHFERKETQKRNQTPLLVTLVFMLAVILAAMAYFLYYTPAEEAVKEAAETQQPEALQEEEPVVDQVAEDTLELQVPSTPEKAAEPVRETAAPTVIQTQPAPTSAVGQLHLVESKGERPVYHLIVASLPNERIAREEAQVILNSGRDVWMIFPAGDTKNFRLSVGSFGSFKSASEALIQAKIDFGESTWILKH
jgi:hypothetical protein